MVSLFDVVFKGVNDLSRLQFVAIALGGNGDDTFAVFVEWHKFGHWVFILGKWLNVARFPLSYGNWLICHLNHWCLACLSLVSILDSGR